jgi:hypothetical protein
MIKRFTFKKDHRGGYVEVIIERLNVEHIVLVDTGDFYNHVQGKNWCIQDCSPHCTTQKLYAKINVGPRSSRKTLYLHRVVTSALPGMVPDHGDSNGLNCRQYNLKLSTQKDNAKRQVHKKRKAK